MQLNVSARRMIGALTLLLVCTGALAAQNAGSSDVRGLHASRADLEQMLVSAEQRANAAGVSGEHRAHARAEADAIRARLQDGDFQVGDEVTLYIEGHPDFSKEYTVEPDRTIVVPGIGTVPLRGVLRSELESHVATYFSHYVRSPSVRARSTIRVMVMGAVGNPGFYSVPSSALVTDVLDSAGGTGHQSRITHIRVERDGQRVLGGQELQDAIIAGYTLDQLNVRAGDRIIVPERREGRLRETLTWVGAVSGTLWVFFSVWDRVR